MPRHAARDARVGELQQDGGSTAEEEHALGAVAPEGIAFVIVRHQYQLTTSECAQALHGVP
ncbi:hypothetical protein GCM10023152_18810 [Agromyces bauzanensis]